MARCSLLLLLLAHVVLMATGIAIQNKANPIRKVVDMLRSMQNKIEEEGAEEKKMYDKFMCYCKTSGADLEASIEASDAKIPQLGSDIEASEAEKTQLDSDVKQAKADREAAKESMSTASAIREKELVAYTKVTTDLNTDVAAINKAVDALENGAYGSSFLQGSVVATFRKLIASTTKLGEDDRQTVMTFLSGSQGSDYAPQSGEIIGILKKLVEEMEGDMADEVAAEKKQVEEYEALMAAKKKEIAALTMAIESKMSRSAELGVAIANMKNELSDTEQALLADKAFFADLGTDCDSKTGEWDEISKTRAEELVALADTIKILNDDDALDLFKKALPSSSGASFLQGATVPKDVKAHALAVLASSSKKGNTAQQQRLQAIAAALRGKKEGFEEVIQMIDEMVELLEKEQVDDDSKKEFCLTQFDESDDEKKALERTLADTGTATEDTSESLEAAEQAMKALTEEIQELDKDVATMTEQRQSERDFYEKTLSDDAAAKELLKIAENRLNEFYNPKLHVTTTPPAMSREDQIYSAFGGEVLTQMAAKTLRVSDADESTEAPPPAPEAPGPYSKKAEESNGVIAMIGLLVKDLDQEMTEMKTNEENGQKQYTEFMKDAADTRAAKSKSLTDEAATKAHLESEMQSLKDTSAATSKELEATTKYIAEMHAECDWLLQYYDTRKEARASEVSSLGDAKAVLRGADYSLLQTAAIRRLRGVSK